MDLRLRHLHGAIPLHLASVTLTFEPLATPRPLSDLPTLGHCQIPTFSQGLWQTLFPLRNLFWYSLPVRRNASPFSGLPASPGNTAARPRPISAGRIRPPSLEPRSSSVDERTRSQASFFPLLLKRAAQPTERPSFM